MIPLEVSDGKNVLLYLRNLREHEQGRADIFPNPVFICAQVKQIALIKIFQHFVYRRITVAVGNRIEIEILGIKVLVPAPFFQVFPRLDARPDGPGKEHDLRGQRFSCRNAIEIRRTRDGNTAEAVSKDRSARIRIPV